MERTLSNAAAAVVADLFIDLQLSVHNGGGLHRTGFLHLADLAAAADLAVKLRNPLANDTQIVQIGLHAVIGTSAHRDLEFMRQLNAGIAMVEHFMDLIGKRVGIQKAVLAGGSLAGYHRTDLGTGSASFQTGFRQFLPQRVNISIGHADDLHRQTGRHGDPSAPVFLSRRRNGLTFRRRNISVSGNNADIEVIGSLIVQAAQRL